MMAEQIEDENKFTQARLPKTIIPSHYELHLKPSFDTFTFSGEVKISYASTGQTNEIVLHAIELVITDGTLQCDNSNLVQQLVSVTYSKKSQTATLQFQDGVAPGTGILCLNFTGLINNRMEGLYRTAIKSGDDSVYAAVTQCEATNARRIFPCWDEPAIKATFTVSLTVAKFTDFGGQKLETVTLSNMPEVSRTGSNEELMVTFDKTPIMSTYLLAFVVGPFEGIEGTDSRRPIRVFTTPGNKEHARFALEVACKSLPFYEDYFNVKYLLPKMDMIAVPDFSFGAMENWGLVIYRETCILFDPNNTATSVKQYIAIVITHELSHQWFGNLVTMEWWTHLWLNEGFATFMSYLCVDNIFPEYDIWSEYMSLRYSAALKLDSLHNSHPIEVPVNNPSEINEIFDDISYNKGAAIIRMLYSFIGEQSFRSGMKDYLTKFAYKNALTENLWDCLGAASNKPVAKLMACWTAQTGYPLLTVESRSTEGDSITLTLTQNRFTADGKLSNDDCATNWLVPIDYMTAGNKTGSAPLLQGKSCEITIEGVGNNWVKLNPGAVNFHRCNYSGELMKRLSLAIADKSLPSKDRLSVQDDFFALCQAGKAATVDLLQFLENFKNETETSIWNSIDACLGRLDTLLSNTNYQDKFHIYGADLLSTILGKLGWTMKPGESHGDTLTRTLILNRLVSFNHQGVVQEALRRFEAFLGDESVGIPADLRGLVYKAVAIHGKDAEFEQLFTLYRTTTMQEEKTRIVRAVASTGDAKRLERVGEFIFSDEVRPQDKPSSIMAIGLSSPSVSWKLIQDKKDSLLEMYASSMLLARTVEVATENFASDERANEIEAFFKANKFPGTERTVKQVLETIRLSAAWLKRDGNTIGAFLSQK